MGLAQGGEADACHNESNTDSVFITELVFDEKATNNKTVANRQGDY